MAAAAVACAVAADERPRRTVKLVCAANGAAPAIPVQAFDAVAWFMIHLYVYAGSYSDAADLLHSSVSTAATGTPFADEPAPMSSAQSRRIYEAHAASTDGSYSDAANLLHSRVSTAVAAAGAPVADDPAPASLDESRRMYDAYMGNTDRAVEKTVRAGATLHHGLKDAVAETKVEVAETKAPAVAGCGLPAGRRPVPSLEEKERHRWLQCHVLLLPCACSVSGKILLNDNPPPFGRGRQAWWDWSIHYHNVIRTDIGLAPVARDIASTHWFARFQPTTAGSDVTPGHAPASAGALGPAGVIPADVWVPLFWRNMYQACWSYRALSPRALRIARAYFDLTVRLAPFVEGDATVVRSVFAASPPPLDRTRDDMWDWAHALCAESHRALRAAGSETAAVFSNLATMSADTATEFWNAEFQMGPGPLAPGARVPEGTRVGEADSDDPDAQIFIVYAALVADATSRAMAKIDR
jgi:hypothetical protein